MKRFTLFTLLLVLLILGTPLSMAAQRGAATSAYQAGQTVEAKWGSDWQEAEVVDVKRTGWVQVRIKESGLTPVLPPTKIRPSSGQGGGTPATGAGNNAPRQIDPMGAGAGRDRSDASDFQVGEQVEVNFGGWKEGEIRAVLPVGMLRVRILASKADVVVSSTQVRRAGEPSPGRETTPEPMMRMWTDSTGKFKVQARFVKREEDQVTIEQADGKQLTLPLTRLSPADQVYVNSLDAPEPSGMQPDATSLAVSTFDSSSAASVALTDPGTSSVTPDGVAEPDSLADKPIPTQGETSKRGRMRGSDLMANAEAVVFHYPTSRAFLTISGKNSPAEVVCIDLEKGKALGKMPLPEGLHVSDVSPNGKRMLVQSERIGHKDDRVRLWDLDDGPKETVAWQPYSSTLKNVDMTAFLDDRRVVTAGGDGSLVAWDTAEQKALYSVPLFRTTVPALSPGRKQIAVASQEGIFVLDSSNGSALARLPGEPAYLMRFGFRPDGRQLAAATSTRLQVWDLENGTRIRDIHFSSSLHLGPLNWVSPGYILVAGTNLVDLERRIVLWRYRWQGPPREGITVGGFFWTMVSDIIAGQRAFVAMKLPHPEAEQMAQTLSPDSLLAVKPGSEVSVQVNASVSAEERQIIRDALTRRLEKNGLRVVDSSKVVLKAETGQGETEEVSYGSHFGRSDAGTTQVTKQVSKLTISEGGNVLWRAQQVKGAPMFVSRQEGESLSSAIAKKLKPTVDFFVNTPVPQYLARPGKDGTYGESMVTARGFVPTDQEAGTVGPGMMIPPR